MDLFSKFILLFSLCGLHLVCAQDVVNPTEETRCPTITQLLAKGCSRGCIIISDSSRSPCHSCSESGGCADVIDECSPSDSTTCTDAQICLSVGTNARYACVDLLGEGAACDVDSDSIDDAIIPCRIGLVCQRDGLDSRVCTTENAQDLESCDFDSFSVRSGERFVDLSSSNCRRCLCTNGEATFCEELSDDVCGRINPTPSDAGDCTFQGRTLEDGESARLDCNLCKCSNGELFCTRRLCDDDDEEDDDDDENDPSEERSCRLCAFMRAEPVCGNDGRTYPSRCFAVDCRELDSEDLTAGSCSRRDVCAENMCEDGEVCVKTGGVTCLSSDGCRPDRLRRCVDLDTLRCRSRDDDDDEDDDESGDGESGDEESSDSDDDDDEKVCGRDMRTYSSVCSLLQNAVDVGVAHAGSCNRTECTGNEVCGTDGETYDNICELRSDSANARVDYRGECEDDDDDEVVIDKCARIRRSNRCAAIASTCTSRILPEDGCCPVCGGAVTVEFDRDAFDEFILLNPELETLDEFLEELVTSGFIPVEIIRSCTITANLLSTGSFHLLLENIMDTTKTCMMFAEEIANRINNPDSTTGTNPQALSFATVAQTSPVVEEVIPSGAMSVVSFSLSLLLLPIITLFV